MFVCGWVFGGVCVCVRGLWRCPGLKIQEIVVWSGHGRVTARGGRVRAERSEVWVIHRAKQGHCTWRDMPSEARCGLHNASLYKKWAGEEAEMVLFSFLIHTPMINKSVQKKVMNICHVCTNYLYYLKQTTSLKTCFVFVFWQLSLNLSSYRSH